jgi:hypothetical protein
MLAIFPAASTDTLVVAPSMQFTGNPSVRSYFFGSASVSGSAEILVYAFDDQGFHLPQFDQQQTQQIYSASASGLEQSAGQPFSSSWSPLVQLQNGTSYALWMILRSFADAGGNGQADFTAFTVTVPFVFISEG